MYAVIKTGGKQYRVAEGDVLEIEMLPQAAGAEVAFDQVLMLVDGAQVRLGSPLVSGATVQGKVLSHGRGDKIRIIKFRRRKHHIKHQGHRQWFSRVEITGIRSGA